MSAYLLVPLLVCIILSITNTQPLTTTKSVNFTAISSNPQNGATLSQIYPTDIQTINNEWELSSSNQNTWHFNISLDTSWSWHSSHISTITLIIDSSTTTMGLPDKDLIVSFSSNNKYFTIVIALDNDNPNWVFPTYNVDIIGHAYDTCDISTINPIPLANGSINSYVTASESFGYTAGEDKATGGRERGSMNPQNMKNGNNKPNSWPLIFTIENYPSSHSIIKLTNNIWRQSSYFQSCAFTPFDAGYGMNIFISPDDNTETFTISRFEIKYAEILTDFPTSYPTPYPSEEPSKSPTKYPTVLPSHNPTKSPLTTTGTPSKSPTKYPTKAPTVNPTTSPLTTDVPSKIPTRYPTVFPSKLPIFPENGTLSPSKLPTLAPLIKTPSNSEPGLNAITPTKSPEQDGLIMDKMNTTNGLYQPQNPDTENTDNLFQGQWIYLIAAMIGGLICILCVIIILIKTGIYKQKRHQTVIGMTSSTNNVNKKHIHIHSLSNNVSPHEGDEVDDKMTAKSDIDNSYHNNYNYMLNYMTPSGNVEIINNVNNDECVSVFSGSSDQHIEGDSNINKQKLPLRTLGNDIIHNDEFIIGDDDDVIGSNQTIGGNEIMEDVVTMGSDPNLGDDEFVVEHDGTAGFMQ